VEEVVAGGGAAVEVVEVGGVAGDDVTVVMVDKTGARVDEVPSSSFRSFVVHPAATTNSASTTMTARLEGVPVDAVRIDECVSDMSKSPMRRNIPNQS
jgi:hypothetical protein